jgi:hypothetical protein
MLGVTTDNGATWEFHPFYLNFNEGDATGVDFTDVSTGYVSAVDWMGRGAIAKTTNGGLDWISTFFVPPLWSIDFPISGASLVGYAAGDQGTILKTNDAGLTWNSQQTGTTQNLNKIYFSNLVEGYAVGENGIILRTVDGGIPVELTSFTANVTGRDIILNWTTATETNNRGFEIEKLFGDTWIVIGFVEGSGTTTETKSYSYPDQDLERGIYQYRLKQIDFDGTYEYTNVALAEVTAPAEFTLSQNYPNPFNPTTNIGFTISDLPDGKAGFGFVSLKIYDVLGNEIETLLNEEKPAGEYKVEFNAEGLSSGIYFYQLKIGSFIETKQMILLQ